MKMENLNVGALIEQVRRRPPLWDMTTEDYKYKAGKYEAWIEVCNAICEGFEEKSVCEKKVIVQSAKEKWRTLRDNFIRSKRQETKTTQKGRKHKRYTYWDQLRFLISNSESQPRDSTAVCPLSNISCSEVSDYDPNESELNKIEIETDHSYVDLNVKTISQYQYEEIQMLEGEDLIVIPATSRTDSFIYEEKIEGLNIERLIDQVRVRPLLWDMTLDDYKDRARKSEAWLEVCNAICEGFEEKSKAEKIVIVQEVKLKWTSVRDNFIRSKRKEYQSSQSRRKHKKYMYWDQLQFLVPNFESRLTEPPTTVLPCQKIHSDLNCTEVSDFGPNDDSEPSQTQVNKSQNEELDDWDGENVLATSKVDILTQPTKHSDEENVMKNKPQKKSEAEPVKMLSEDEQFFNSLLSSVAELSDLQKLQFRIEVMQALVRAKQS